MGKARISDINIRSRVTSHPLVPREHEVVHIDTGRLLSMSSQTGTTVTTHVRAQGLSTLKRTQGSTF